MSQLSAATLEQIEAVETLLEQMEEKVIAFGVELENAYEKRCHNIDTYDTCLNNNYYDCWSKFPNQMCIKDKFNTSGCDISCNGELLSEDQRAPRSCCNPQTHIFLSPIVSQALWEDTTISQISLPYSVMQSNTSDIIQDVAETACYSRLVEAYMVGNFTESESQLFGAHNGFFRMTSALGRNESGSFDPRIRPWFVAAASGPKDVVLVIDIDGASKVTREAAIAVVGTLNVDDRFTVMALTNGVDILLEGSSTFIPATSLNINDLILLRATSVNQNNAIEAINNLMPDGQTDIYTAFEFVSTIHWI